MAKTTILIPLTTFVLLISDLVFDPKLIGSLPRLESHWDFSWLEIKEMWSNKTSNPHIGIYTDVRLVAYKVVWMLVEICLGENHKIDRDLSTVITSM